MDKKELILRKLSTIGLSNKIVELNNTIQTQNTKNNEAYNKSKQLFNELFQNNKNLTNEKTHLENELTLAKQEIETLNNRLIYQQMIIEKIPKFLLKFIMRNKNIKLLNEGNK